jgi:hypothetical protein
VRTNITPSFLVNEESSMIEKEVIEIKKENKQKPNYKNNVEVITRKGTIGS